jgi:hypothetical protein
VSVVAKLIGHSVDAAIRAYCKAQEATRQQEMTQYLSSLEKTVLSTSEQRVIPIQAIPAGGCAKPGEPLALEESARSASQAPVQPDCKKAHGCFFCAHYRAHADEKDMRKLMSCRIVLKKIAHLQGGSLRAERVYTVVVDRIEALLAELKRREPKVFEATRVDVEDRGQLSRYWANKLSQLHLLGMVAPEASPTRP